METLGKLFCSDSFNPNWHMRYEIVMSPSWNFPARAEPSYEGSEPSRAELGHFNFRAETELDFFYISNSKVFGNQKTT